ncbi:MAG: putative glycoside hydrolase [Patescibacteria group bacterium]|nr:putative glycoside hydrolase [Patescibacteria group bacterium]
MKDIKLKKTKKQNLAKKSFLVFFSFLISFIFLFSNSSNLFSSNSSSDIGVRQVSAELSVKDVSYPRLANYFLHWELSDYEAKELAKWDLLILDMEVSQNSPDKVRRIRELNPDIIILAYITSQEIMDDLIYNHLGFLRYDLKNEIIDSWYLKSSSGSRLSYWQNTHLLNLSDGSGTNSSGLKFNEFLPIFVKNEILSTNLFDGVFYDNAWGNVSWSCGDDVDINNDGIKDDVSYVNSKWEEGYDKMLEISKNLFGNEYIIIGNAKVHLPYQNKLNGMMFEDFPSSWEGTWSDSLNTYSSLKAVNKEPKITIINSYNKNRENYSKMRFSLTSTLLENGFYSFDYDTSDHGQLWWYDEYDFNLGNETSDSINLLNREMSNSYSPSLWRRNFENGSVFVNSTNFKQNFIFRGEKFSKLKGEQDKEVNSGEEVNYISLEPNTGIILRSSKFELKNAIFKNGYYYKYLNGQGSEKKSAGFAFSSSYPGQAELAFIPQNNYSEAVLSTYKGEVELREGGSLNLDFRPFGQFSGDLSIAYSLNNNNLEKIAIGAGLGGGPQVMLYDKSGRHERNFFAYDKNLRGGVNVAMFDVNNDNYQEIITGPGKGEEPLIKVFDERGKMINSFLAYNKNFKGGVNVVAGDLNNDGNVEIITIPAANGGPQVRIFDYQGNILGTFFAFDKDINGEFVVSLSDVDNDGSADIIVGQKNPY